MGRHRKMRVEPGAEVTHYVNRFNIGGHFNIKKILEMLNSPHSLLNSPLKRAIILKDAIDQDTSIRLVQHQEPIKWSLHLPYMPLESTLSRVDL